MKAEAMPTTLEGFRNHRYFALLENLPEDLAPRPGHPPEVAMNSKPCTFNPHLSAHNPVIPLKPLLILLVDVTV